MIYGVAEICCRAIIRRDLRNLSEKPVHALIEVQVPVRHSDCVTSFRAP